MKKHFKSLVSGLLIVLFAFSFICCISSAAQRSNAVSLPATQGSTALPSFLELTLGDNINYSLFTMTGNNRYQMKVPQMVNVFGRQPAGVTVELDTDNKIQTIYYYYGISGDFFPEMILIGQNHF